VRNARFVDVPADRLLEDLKKIGNAVISVGGSYRQWTPRSGSEIVVDIAPPIVPAIVRIYTTITDGAGSVRACGEDAVRLFLCWSENSNNNPVIFLEEPQKILRTAPKGAPDRVQAFLDRLRDEVRAAYARALSVPTCPKCKKRPMKLRTTKDGTRQFYGCVGWPRECVETMSVNEYRKLYWRAPRATAESR
jgi:hypothetical protein